MHPDLFSIGPLTLHTYGLFIAIGFIIGLLIAIKTGKRHGIDTQQIMDMGIILIISGVIGSKITYVLMNFSSYSENPLDINLWRAGFVFSGGLLTAIIVFIFYIRHHKLNILQVCDIWAPAAAIGQAMGRIGCFFAGCCYGRPTTVPWSVIFRNPESIAPLNIPLHPTQLYDFMSNSIIFIVLMILSAKKKFDGQVILWFLILHSTARLFIERFRGDPRGIFPGTQWTVTQFIAILILFFSVSALIYIKSKNEKFVS